MLYFDEHEISKDALEERNALESNKMRLRTTVNKDIKDTSTLKYHGKTVKIAQVVTKKQECEGQN